ncbi:hypothetical protein [Absidia glauca]|uniref:AP complex mu/sigma subunit domain-containing protein n=1 Tax=Absidia glauca TaxID=4829 RepID=A0A168R3I2_ABSGL|nr:hypothetical protein [Absidia glauca]
MQEATDLIFTFSRTNLAYLNGYSSLSTELDIVFQLEKVHMIMEELLPRGIMVESNQERILAPLQLG